ncbi:MAG: dTMP kinase [Candidatus Buchananbacteria bacterium]|nr:dTMP kinase [Candidatus Buchananbacteria bacterium]
MFKNKFKGKFIAIEGLDGCGSTTQTLRIENYLKKIKKPYLVTNEPTNNVIGGIIKAYVEGDIKLTSPASLQLLFAADRANHLEQEIIPNLKGGINVITDRYFLSSLAYGALNIADDGWLYNINDLFLIPDLTILIKTSAKTCVKRIKANRLGVELFENEDKLKKVWNNYEMLSKKYPNISVVDGEKSEDEVFSDIQKEIDKIIK